MSKYYDPEQDEFVRMKEAAQEWAMDHDETKHECAKCHRIIEEKPNEIMVWQTGGMYHLECADPDEVSQLFRNGKVLCLKRKGGRTRIFFAPSEIPDKRAT